MIPILAPEARSLLEDLALSRALLVFDYDGTLVPLGPEQGQLGPGTRALLRALCVLHPCAVLSSRPRPDLAARLRGIPLVAVVGSHGAEAGHGPLDRTQRPRLIAWREALAASLRDTPGIALEDRRFSLAVHLRGQRSRAGARRRVIAAATALPEARVLSGRAVVHLLPPGAPGKAAAVEEIRRRAGAHRVLYVGDDRTDEEVFRAGIAQVSVRVGRTSRSAASHYLPTQRAVDDLLRALLAARTSLDGLGERWEGLARAVGA